MSSAAKYLCAVWLCALLASDASAVEVVVLTYQDAIGPVAAEYVERGIREAEARRAAAVILRLDTPGGLDSSMRRIIHQTMNAQVPVVVYVAPRGARAASAGCLIVFAADVAAMAPGTNLGAAHPLYITGEPVSEKVLNDAVAYARSLAAANNRNADWAEKAVRENASIPQGEAVQLKVVDLAANDVDDLLRQLDGRVVRTGTGEVTLRLSGARPLWLEMSWRERFLKALTNPTLAYLLLVLGTLAIIFELVTPGGFLAGAFGGVAVVLALVGLVNLPVQLSGAALLVLGLVLFVAELKIMSHGLLTLAGVVSFILGSLLLFPRVPGYRVSWWAIGTMVLFWAAAFSIVFRLVLKAHRRPVLAGVEGLVGAAGVAKTELALRGIVLVEGEDWNAEAESAPIAAGEKVQVLGVQGLTLRVRKFEEGRRAS
jgi:membrane-bound serine protease (ClpP class)